MQEHSFKEIIPKYETIFFDAYGVLKNHQGILEGIDRTLDFLNEKKIDFFVLTNDASRSPAELAYGYRLAGLPQITEDKIISSVMLAREYLQLKVQTGTIAYIGTKQSANYFEAIGLKTISVKNLDRKNADQVSALVFLDDEGFNWSSNLNKTVNLLRNNNIPVIVSNTDISYPTSRNEVNIAIGALASMIESIVGKKFIRFGKPDSQIFMFAYEHSINHGGTADKNKILMVGDTIQTDILGGNKFGLDTALVLTGNTIPKHAEMRINSLGIAPTYICESAGL